MPTDSDAIANGGEPGRYSPSFSDALFQNERVMWWAEFDSVGEDTVRSYVERNAYPPTGMEAAREWLAERGIPQSREDVQPVRPLADQIRDTAPEHTGRSSEELTLASRVDANSRAIAEIAANAKRNARTMILVGTGASLLALCAIVMVLASSRQVAPEIKQASLQPPRPSQPVMRPVSTAEPPAVPPAEADETSAIPPENDQKALPPNTQAVTTPDLKPQGQSVGETLALIADKVGTEGTINFAAQIYDMATGRDHTEQLSYKASNVTIDPNRCQVGYRWHVEQNGAVSDQDRTIELRLAKSIKVTTIDAEPSHRFVMHAEPKVYVVHIARWDNASGDHLYFREEGMAARVASATRRAVALCDNGTQQVRRGQE